MASVTLPSSEFDPGVGDRPYPGGAAVFNNALWLVGCGQAMGNMYQTTFDLSLLSNTDGLTDQRNWVSTELSVPKGASTLARCSLEPGLTDLYLVWNQMTWEGESSTSTGLFSSAYSLASSPPAWGTRVQMQDDGGNPVKPLGIFVLDPFPPPLRTAVSDVSATVFGQDADGNDILIVGCIISPSLGKSELYLGTYNSAQIDATANVWPAQSSATFTASEIWPSFPDLDNVGTTLTLDSFPTASADSSGQPILTLVAGLDFQVPAEHGTTPTGIGVVLPVASDGTIGALPSMGGYLLNDDPPVPLCCLRDPAGRLQAYWPTPGQDISDRTYALGQAIPGNPNMPTSGADETFPAKSANDIPMSVVFFIDTADSTTDPTAIGYTTSCPIYRFMFYGSRVKCQVQQFGIATILAPQSTYRPTKQLNVVTGIIDGPIPTPNQNLGPGTPTSNLGMVVYSSTDTEAVAHQTSCAWTVGIQDNFQTTKGVGPAWNVSLNSGAGSVAGKTSESVDSMAQTLSVEVDPSSQLVLPYAAAFCYGVEFVVTGYQVLTPDGDPISDPTQVSGPAPQMVVISTNLIDPPPQNYIPFSVTPGDLSSYTPQSWNTTMKLLGYEGENYFGDVIVANAYTFDSGDKYIPMGWGRGATDTTTYGATESSFTEKSWTFNSSIYGGVSFGGGFALFGMGEEAAGSLLAGTTFAAEAETTDTSSQQWGIAILPQDYGPAVLPEVPTAMAGYAFRLYFLPVPSPPLPTTYWASELVTYLPKDAPPSTLDPASIDPSSAPWRIVFVVTSYQSNDGKTVYQYDGSLG